MILQYEILEKEIGSVFVTYRCLSHEFKFTISSRDSVRAGTANIMVKSEKRYTTAFNRVPYKGLRGSDLVYFIQITDVSKYMSSLSSVSVNTFPVKFLFLII